MVTIWPRQNYVTGGDRGIFALVALAKQRLVDPLPVSRSRHGMPDGDGAMAVKVTVRERQSETQWFDESIVAPFSTLIENDLDSASAAELATAQFAYIISCDIEDPDDLGHVQAGWALAKCICEQGAMAVIDVTAARAHHGRDVAALEPLRDFDIMHDVTLFFDERDQGKSMIAWTAGMQKFGRCNLVIANIARDYAAVAATILRDAALLLADGDRLEIGDTITIDERTFVAIPVSDDHGTSLDGPGIMLDQIDTQDQPL
jgi:hypothetical protein